MVAPGRLALYVLHLQQTQGNYRVCTIPRFRIASRSLGKPDP